MLDTLFGLIPAGSRGQQWLAGELQLVNWGGYDGAHRILFSPEATLLCGGSGSGKSTLMDAYIALMMPHTTPFNGASNGGVTGRPRGEEQRNIISYGRGKLDETRTDEGTKVRVLRGDGADTWTAVAMTWVDHDGSRFSALRAWYIPAGARTLEDTVRTRATIDAAFDLSSLEAAAAQRFSDSSLKALGLSPIGTEREFTARLHSVLGIGAAGAGSKAMNLLARIQAGQQITTVDDLYKRLVLEEPAALDAADAVVAHFDELESTRTRMLVARQQVAALTPIRELHTKIDAARQRAELIAELGEFSQPGSLAALWAAQRRLELLQEVEAELGARTKTIDHQVREQRALRDAAAAERDSLSEVLRKSGGDKLEAAQRALRDLDRRLAEVETVRSRFISDLDVLDVTVTTRDEFERLATTARTTLGDAHAKTQVRNAYAEAKSAQTAVMNEVAELSTELRNAATYTGNIPRALYESRAILAEAAGIDPAHLPFVAELIELRTQYEPWREAFNLALGSFATTLLIAESDLDHFRAAIERTRTPQRLRYEGVPVKLSEREPNDKKTLPGRLDYTSSPFTGWLQQRLTERFNYVCVDSTDDFATHQLALTIAGQISQGTRGAHGGHGRTNVLGFSNERRVRELTELRSAATTRLEAAQAAVQHANREHDAFDARQTAYARIVELTWDQIDIDQLTTDRNRWLRVEAELTEGNPEIAQLTAQIAAAKERITVHSHAMAKSELELEQVEAQWSATVDQVDASNLILEIAEDKERVLSGTQQAYLDERFTPPESDAGLPASKQLDRFTLALDNAARQLDEDRQFAQDAYLEHRENLRRVMSGFLERWDNPNLVADPDTAVGDFERILVSLETSGLHELEAEWRDSLVHLSGNDLTHLDSTLSRSLREIRERIEPINQIMRDLPFYDEQHRLQITIREHQSDPRRRFRQELRAVRQLIEKAASEAEREAVYVRMAKLIERIRRNAPDFTQLVDVRTHVRVSAERITADTKQHIALYDHIGEKSGGESQELIAFIVGAALRYQLGDAGAERPRYAPVFMDEALIKADAHFTERAIGAWRGLGFQLVIGAPNDKYSAIEPHVQLEYDILKDTQGRSWAKAKVALPA